MLNDNDIEIIETWLNSFLSFEKVYIFGGQIRGDNTKTSDIDFAFVYNFKDNNVAIEHTKMNSEITKIESSLGYPLNIQISANKTDLIWDILEKAENEPWRIKRKNGKFVYLDIPKDWAAYIGT